MRNRPRILFEYDVKPFTNKRMDARQFVNSLSIRGWSLGAIVNALRGVQSQTHMEDSEEEHVTGTSEVPVTLGIGGL